MFNLVREPHQAFQSTRPKTGNHITSCKQPVLYTLYLCTYVPGLCCVPFTCVCIYILTRTISSVYATRSPANKIEFGLVMSEMWTIFSRVSRICASVGLLRFFYRRLTVWWGNEDGRGWCFLMALAFDFVNGLILTVNFSKADTRHFTWANGLLDCCLFHSIFCEWKKQNAKNRFLYSYYVQLFHFEWKRLIFIFTNII